MKTSMTSASSALNMFINNDDVIREQDNKFSEIFDEMMDSLMLESVNHFTKFHKPSSLADDARYFYTSKEMKQFFKMFLANGGDLSVLRTNKVYDNHGNFLCYEICRGKIFKRIYGTSQNVYYGHEIVDVAPFLPKN